MKFFVFFVVFGHLLGADAVTNGTSVIELSPRVIGGQDVPMEPPFVPAFILKLTFWYVDPTNNQRVFRGWCGSTVIDQQNLLTAAHCIQGADGHVPPATDVRVLDEDGNEMKGIFGVPVRHHDHNPVTRQNDIAIVILNKDLGHRHSVEIASSTDHISNPMCRVYGFGGDGKHQPQWLQFIEFPLADDKMCKDNRKRFDSERELCCEDPTFKSKVCPGDSGKLWA